MTSSLLRIPCDTCGQMEKIPSGKLMTTCKNIGCKGHRSVILAPIEEGKVYVRIQCKKEQYVCCDKEAEVTKCHCCNEEFSIQWNVIVEKRNNQDVYGSAAENEITKTSSVKEEISKAKETEMPVFKETNIEAEKTSKALSTQKGFISMLQKTKEEQKNTIEALQKKLAEDGKLREAMAAELGILRPLKEKLASEEKKTSQLWREKEALETDHELELKEVIEFRDQLLAESNHMNAVMYEELMKKERDIVVLQKLREEALKKYQGFLEDEKRRAAEERGKLLAEIQLMKEAKGHLKEVVSNGEEEKKKEEEKEAEQSIEENEESEKSQESFELGEQPEASGATETEVQS